jgi:hypothetical protein
MIFRSVPAVYLGYKYLVYAGGIGPSKIERHQNKLIHDSRDKVG